MLIGVKFLKNVQTFISSLFGLKTYFDLKFIFFN